MKTLIRAGLIAAAVLTGTAAGAQTMEPAAQASPVVPRLIAPRNLAFNPGDAAAHGVTAAAWRSARGTWRSSTEDGMLTTRMTFSGLVPNGHYSVFSRHVSGKSMVVAPIDQSGMTNSFRASPTGAATMTVSLSQPLVAGDGVLLVYHAAGADHPKTIGHLGVDAYIQLRLKLT